MWPVATRFRPRLASSTHWRASLVSTQQFSSGKPADVENVASKSRARNTGKPSNEKQRSVVPNQRHNSRFSNPGDEVRGFAADIQGTSTLAVQFNRYKGFVEGLNEKESPASPPASPHRIREALEFFTSKKTFAYAGKNNMHEIPSQCASVILDYLEKQYFNGGNSEWIQPAVMSSTYGPCGVLVVAMKHFLQPLKGTSFSMRMYGSRQRNREEIHQNEQLRALKQASRIKNLIIHLVKDPACPDIVHVLPMCLGFLELWSCRTWYLGRHSTTELHPDVYASTFEGMKDSKQCIDAMLQFIHRMERQQEGLPKPDASAYFLYIEALAKSGSKGSAARAHEVLLYMEKNNVQRVSMFNITLMAYCNEAKVDPTAVEGAQKLYNHMLSEETSVVPDSVTAATLLNTYTNARMPEQAEKILLDLERKSMDLGLAPSRVEYNIVVNSWAKSPEPNGVERAFALFQRMLELSESGANVNASPDKITYTILIDAFLRNPRTGKEGIERAESLLNHAESGEDPRVTPDAKMYKTYISSLFIRLLRQREGYAKAEIASRVEALLERMKEKSKVSPPSEADFWHNTSIYNKAIAAWSNTKVPHAIKRTVRLYNELMKEYRNSNFNAALKPDAEIYDSVMACLGTRQNVSSKRGVGPKAVTLAQRILRDMERNGLPLTLDFINQYLKVLSVSGVPDAIGEAEQALQYLEEDYAAGHSNVVPNEFSYLYVMDGYAKNGGPEHAERLLNQMISLSNRQEARKNSIAPSMGCYNIVMDAWSRSGRSDSVEHVERIMQQLEARGFQPDFYGYTTLITTYARNALIEDAPEKAEAILRKMQSDFQSGKNPNCKPNSASFASVIRCWEMSRKDDAAEHIEAIILRMKELSCYPQYSDLNPNFSCFRHAIKAWLHSKERRPDAGDRAMGLLDLIDESFLMGKLEAHYVMYCYNLVMFTIARSRDGEKATKARNVLDRMQRQGIKPRAKDFRAVLSACRETASVEGATDSQKQEAFRIANVSFFDFLESDLKADSGVYKEMLDLHTLLLVGEDEEEERREKSIRAIFSNAPEEVQQSREIWSSLRAALPTSVYEELITKADGYYERRK